MNDDEKNNLAGKSFLDHKSEKQKLECLKAQLNAIIHNSELVIRILKGEIRTKIIEGTLRIGSGSGHYTKIAEWPELEKIIETLEEISTTTERVRELEDQLNKIS